MLGLQIFLADRKYDYSPKADEYLQEIMDTCHPLQWEENNGWLVFQEKWQYVIKGWTKYWRVWGNDYPSEWLCRISWTDWGCLNPERFNDIPWVNAIIKKMPSKKMSWKFYRWLKSNGIRF